MTDIDQKARALVADVVAETRPDYTGSPWNSSTILNEALYRAIEQHEAFKQEVSDAITALLDRFLGDSLSQGVINGHLHRFIIRADKPDPLDEIMGEFLWSPKATDDLRAALEARGLEIRSKNDV
jgi:hypothetical protein